MTQKAEGRLKVEKRKFQTAATEVTMDHIGEAKIIPKRVSPDSTEAEEGPLPPTPGRLVTRTNGPGAGLEGPGGWQAFWAQFSAVVWGLSPLPSSVPC